MRKLFALLFILPLAACFDADIAINFVDDENAEMEAVMTMGPEFYAMLAQSGEDPCEEGVGAAQADGSYLCTITETDTIDNMIAEANAPSDDGNADGPTNGMTQGYAIERVGTNMVKVSFDLSEMLSDAKPDEELGEMEAMLRQAFAGHGITMRVSGQEILDTNGEMSADGKSASFAIPLTEMLETEPDLPSSFDVTVRTE
ncbi:hypothetical protein [Aliiroseovarius subalbicans]|uniref:hypothetical protein n=1 Tax=Aliiroseovarius subalbicans TaxID=2925840 RepID=UPI001F5802C8|nr:hypothetical protein [Aliiroseovarius subalbicans]MCI2399874.1 hypothetical protein [Aliiroseovarius subalbicans]